MLFGLDFSRSGRRLVSWASARRLLRLWESVGLISPARNSGKYRLYNPEMLEVLKRIKYLRDVKKLNEPGIQQELGNGRPPAAPVQSEQVDGPPAKLRKLRKRLSLGILKAAETSPDFARVS